MIHIGLVKPHHAHRFQAKTTEASGHYHQIDGFTLIVNGNSFDRHRHYFRGVTTTANNHYHRFYGETGPAIPFKNGGHYHLFESRTYYNYDEASLSQFGGVTYGEGERPKHDHTFSGKTLEIVGEDPFFSRFLKG
ncbi:MAG TPA: YmaF family protein [Metabacillus sp.]|nr:YmaF family protein [Metabacillus sp.]